MQLGYDRDGKKEKHYRHLLKGELEKSGLIDKSPFYEIPINRGRLHENNQFFKKLMKKKDSTYSDFQVNPTFMTCILILCKNIASRKLQSND